MKVIESLSNIAYLQCHACKQAYSPSEIATISTCCGRPLIARYSFTNYFPKESLLTRQKNMWRYAEMLPLFDINNRVSLGEGYTPILPLQRLASKHGYKNLLMKDESSNPTGSFKARGLSMAISKAKEFNIESCIIPTAGNAGGAMAAYCAAAGIEATVVMPTHTPKIFKDECELYGANLILVDGLISDCGKKVAELKKNSKYFDISTIKEPYRIEGKKTMGYEIAEQLDWQLPDVILYPAGGGTGLIGIWKAFQEMIDLGWILPTKLPRMIAVQAENCCPVVATWVAKQDNCSKYVGKPSLANGLAVPNPFAENLMLEVLHASGGLPITVSDQEMIAGVKEIARIEGLLISPEGAATWIALQKLVAKGIISDSEEVLLLNTGSGYKYLENII